MIFKLHELLCCQIFRKYKMSMWPNGSLFLMIKKILSIISYVNPAELFILSYQSKVQLINASYHDTFLVSIATPRSYRSFIYYIIKAGESQILAEPQHVCFIKEPGALRVCAHGEKKAIPQNNARTCDDTSARRGSYASKVHRRKRESPSKQQQAPPSAHLHSAGVFGVCALGVLRSAPHKRTQQHS